MVRRPTIIDVARLANVSKSTVARVVNGELDRVREETRHRVLDAIEQLGYERNVIAGSLRSDKTLMVALCIPDITNPFWPEVVRSAQDTIEEEGYAVVTVNSDWRAVREADYLRMVRRNRFDGLIINPTSVTNDVLESLGIPVVILGSGYGFPTCDSVGSDTEGGVQHALDHLFDLGHRRIGLIAGISARGNLHHSRRQSFITFHARKHILLDESLIVESEFSDQGGYDALQQLLSLEQPPTAIFAANDLLAIGALKAAQARGCRVPDHISIVGMDDIYAAATTSPALTTVTKPKTENGTQAARFLLERMAGKGPQTPRHVKIPCQLTVRESTGPPP